MSSLRRIESSRANGARSCGPKSPETKQVSARNSLRHGMLSTTIVLGVEADDRFEKMVANLTSEFQPITEAEVALVESMAVARWRQMRIWGIEKSTYDREIDHQNAGDTNGVRAAAAFKYMADHTRTLDLIHRYETGYERQFTRAMQNLLKLKESRKQDDDRGPYTPASPATGTFKPDFPNEPNPISEQFSAVASAKADSSATPGATLVRHSLGGGRLVRRSLGGGGTTPPVPRAALVRRSLGGGGPLVTRHSTEDNQSISLQETLGLTTDN